MREILVRKLARVLTGDGYLSPSSGQWPAMVLEWHHEHPTCLPLVCPRATRRVILTVLSLGISPDRLWEGYSQCKDKWESPGVLREAANHTQPCMYLSSLGLSHPLKKSFEESSGLGDVVSISSHGRSL